MIFNVYMPHLFLNLISVCTAQYAESDLTSIMRFVEIRTILVLILHFAVSKTDEILSLGGGDHCFLNVTAFLLPPLSDKP